VIEIHNKPYVPHVSLSFFTATIKMPRRNHLHLLEQQCLFSAARRWKVCDQNENVKNRRFFILQIGTGFRHTSCCVFAVKVDFITCCGKLTQERMLTSLTLLLILLFYPRHSSHSVIYITKQVTHRSYNI